MTRIIRFALAAAATCLFCASASAQSFPSRAVRLIVPFAAGGPSDTYAREVAPRLSEQLRQPVVVENIPGGNSIAGTVAVARAAPDGHTLLLVANTHATIESLVARKPYQLLRDLVPVASINQIDLVLVVPRSSPVATLQDLISLAKARPKALSYASSGPGSAYHMAGELFKAMSGTDLVHVPYKSAVNARSDLLAAEVHLMFDALPSAEISIQDGHLRAIAVTGKQRTPSLPNVPTIAEAGLPDYEAVLWTGIMAPARTPREIIERLNSAINRVIGQADLREVWTRQGATPLAMSAAEFARFVGSDIERWGRVVKLSGTRVD